MYEGFSQARHDGLLAGLSGHGWARATEVVSAATSDALLRRAQAADWTALAGEGHALETAPLADPNLAAILGADELRFMRHAPGDYGLPPAVETGIGFVLDLTPGWASQHGGLLLFAQGDRVRGWRPEQGALTLFELRRPLILSVVGPEARGPRVAVLGRLAEG